MNWQEPGAMMRLRLLTVTVTAMALTACDSAPPPDLPLVIPTAVACADAASLRQQATDDRRQSDTRSSDQEKIVFGNRASFFSALAVIADLECKLPSVDADGSLKSAFEAARAAEVTSSFYEEARKWAEASYLVTQAAAPLIQQLPASSK